MGKFPARPPDALSAIEMPSDALISLNRSARIFCRRPVLTIPERDRNDAATGYAATQTDCDAAKKEARNRVDQLPKHTPETVAGDVMLALTKAKPKGKNRDCGPCSGAGCVAWRKGRSGRRPSLAP